MIKNQISALRELAELQNISYHKSIINRAADTIEALSEKLTAANIERSEAYYNDGWIPFKDKLTEQELKIIKTLADCNMNVQKTSNKMNYHRNTIVYHLQKIENETGLNPMNFHDLVKLTNSIKE